MGPVCPMLGGDAEEASHLVSVGCREMRLWQLTCIRDQAVSKGGEEPPPRTSIGTGSMGGPVPVSGGVRSPAWGRVTPPLFFPLPISTIHLERHITGLPAQCAYEIVPGDARTLLTFEHL